MGEHDQWLLALHGQLISGLNSEGRIGVEVSVISYVQCFLSRRGREIGSQPCSRAAVRRARVSARRYRWWLFLFWGRFSLNTTAFHPHCQIQEVQAYVVSHNIVCCSFIKKKAFDCRVLATAFTSTCCVFLAYRLNLLFMGIFHPLLDSALRRRYVLLLGYVRLSDSVFFFMSN